MKYAILALFFAVNAKAGIPAASQPGGSSGIAQGADFNGDDGVFKTLQSTGTAPSLTATGVVSIGTVTIKSPTNVPQLGLRQNNTDDGWNFWADSTLGDFSGYRRESGVDALRYKWLNAGGLSVLGGPSTFASSVTVNGNGYYSGNLGIGTASPASKLDVVGDAQFGSGVAKSTFTTSGQLIMQMTASQTIAAGNTVAADACGGIKRITAGGAVTTDTTNTFTAPAIGNGGCCMDVINVGTQNITLDNNANFFSAGAADVVLGGNDTVRVCSTGASGFWYQVGATGNN